MEMNIKYRRVLATVVLVSALKTFPLVVQAAAKGKVA